MTYDEYLSAMDRIEVLMTSEYGTKEGEELDYLVTLVCEYEDTYFIK